MKQTKKSRANLFTIIFLLVLLAFVLAYLGLVYPRLNEQIAELDMKTSTLHSEINRLIPYESQIDTLSKKAVSLKTDFETNNDLHDPVLFSNIIYEAADATRITVQSLSINENSQITTQDGFAARSFTATITVTLTNGKLSNEFISKLENNTGCAMYISSLAYSKRPAEENLESDAITEPDTATLTIEMLTVEKQ